jgi:hypothetical protein
MKRRMQSVTLLFVHLSIPLVVVFVAIPASAGMEAHFLYTLSDFKGTVQAPMAKLAVDYERNETYVIYQDAVRVFDINGMEIYSFSDSDTRLGTIRDLVVLPDGDIITLAFVYEEGKLVIVRRNYRGEPVSEIELKDLPSELAHFKPNRMRYRNESLYFADPQSFQVVVTDINGRFKKLYDLASLLEIKAGEKTAGDVLMTGFDVDPKGNLLFTVSVFFKAYMLSPDGQFHSFGEAGSLPGKFNIVSDIAADNRGNYFVGDKLKNAIQVFNSGGQFLYIFGDWGGKAGTLFSPTYITVNRKDMVFVSQGGIQGGGVNVYRMFY